MQWNNDFISAIKSGDKPDPMEYQHLLDIDRIGHALSKIQRYAGNYPYENTVADHSLRCYNIARRSVGDPVALAYVLLHDAHESSIGDIAYEVKKLPAMRDLDALASAFFINSIVGPVKNWMCDLVSYCDRLDAINEFYVAGWEWPKEAGVGVPDSIEYTNAMRERMCGQHNGPWISWVDAVRCELSRAEEIRMSQ